MQGKNYAWPVTAISKEDYKDIEAWIKQYGYLLAEKKIMIFGAGIRGAVFSSIFELFGITDITFTDNNPEKWNGNIDEHPIIPVEEAIKLKNQFVFIISVEEGRDICCQLEEKGLLTNKDYFFFEGNQYLRFMREYQRETRGEILFLGDCMFEVVAFDDENKSSMLEMINDELGEDAKCLTVHGLSAPGFLHMIRGQINKKMIPRCIVMMINFETLTGKQHLLPRSQHTFLIRSTCEITPDPDGKMHEYLELTETRVKNVKAEFFTTDKFTSGKSNNENGKISNTASKMFFKMNYLYNLDTEMESIECIREIMKLSRDNDIKLIPFIPPVNFERGAELFGIETFETGYKNNVKKLRKVINEGGYELLDLSHICSSGEFAHVTTPDETTNYFGRKRVISEIIECLKVKGIV